MLIADRGSVTHPVFLLEILTIVFDLLLIICFTQHNWANLSDNVAREGGMTSLIVHWIISITNYMGINII